MISSLTSSCVRAFAQEGVEGRSLPTPQVPVYQAVDQLLDLSSERRGIFRVLEELTPAARERFLMMTANILKTGIVGYELCDTGRRKPEQRYLLTCSADDVLPKARAYREPIRQRERGFDVRA
jgi:hypothetical protein